MCPFGNQLVASVAEADEVKKTQRLIVSSAHDAKVVIDKVFDLGEHGKI
jgi:hypothetical protein